jgi:hypothetical protein
VDEAHIHPFDAHYQLALIATYALIQTNFRHPEHNHNNILAAVPSCLELRWGQGINLVPFRDITIDIYAT